jgi:hypothetical protein
MKRGPGTFSRPGRKGRKGGYFCIFHTLNRYLIVKKAVFLKIFAKKCTFYPPQPGGGKNRVFKGF